MSVWFAANAVAPQLALRWGLSPSEAGWLSTIVQLGFVAGTAARRTAEPRRRRSVARLLQHLGGRRRRAPMPRCAALRGTAPRSSAVRSPACFSPGVYPPAMKMAATWFRARRGLAIGVVVGALTIGKARALPRSRLSWSRHARRSCSPRRPRALSAALLVALLYHGRAGALPASAVRPGARRHRARRNTSYRQRARRLLGAHARALRVLDLDSRASSRRVRSRAAASASGSRDDGVMGGDAVLRRHRDRRRGMRRWAASWPIAWVTYGSSCSRWR